MLTLVNTASDPRSHKPSLESRVLNFETLNPQRYVNPNSTIRLRMQAFMATIYLAVYGVSLKARLARTLQCSPSFHESITLNP